MAYTDLTALRKAVQERRYVFSDRAAQRLGERGISRSDALAVIEIGVLIEEPPDDLPYSKSLLMAGVNDHVVYLKCAFDGDEVYITAVQWSHPSITISAPARPRTEP